METHIRMTGRQPRGYRAPVYNVTPGVIDRLIETKFLYNSSLMADDIPYLMKTPQGELIEMPLHWGTDDWPPFAHFAEIGYLMPVRAPSDGLRAFFEEFEAAHAVGGFWMPVLHPFLTGRLARWAAMERWLETMLDMGDVWFARWRRSRATPWRTAPCSAPTAGRARMDAFDPAFLPVSGFDLPRFAGIPTFMRLPIRDLMRREGVEIGLVGVPWDGGTTNRPGARHGPRALRDASTMVRMVNQATAAAPFHTARCADLGDVGAEPGEPGRHAGAHRAGLCGGSSRPASRR